MRESAFTASLRPPLIAAGIYPLKLNLSFQNGVADCWYSGHKRDLWNEQKFLKTLPKTIDPCKLLTPLQQLWLTARAAEGRNVAVIIGSPEGCVWLPGLSWKNPLTRDEYRAKMVKKKKLIEDLIEYLGAKEHNGPELSPPRDSSCT